jgi:chromatin remodeling complex protein RSC6
MAKKATKKATAKKTTAKKAAPAKKATAKKATAKTAAPKAAATKKVAKKAAAPKKAKTARKPNAAFMQAFTPSAELAAVIGAAAAARTEVVKKLWAYIKKHNLQNPKNKRNILADDKLKKVFGKNEVSMFELASLIGKHLK